MNRIKETHYSLDCLTKKAVKSLVALYKGVEPRVTPGKNLVYARQDNTLVHELHLGQNQAVERSWSTL